MRYPEHLSKLIDTFKRFPGVGSKTAERFAFQVISWPKERLHEMAQTLTETDVKLNNCLICHALIGDKACPFCTNPNRANGTLCVVASPKEVFLIEETQTFSGRYHVLGALLSPLDGHTLPSQALDALKQRLEKENIQEIILALDATLEGDATALYLTEELKSPHIKLTRLALGLPIGTSLDYIDGGTLARALTAREAV